MRLGYVIGERRGGIDSLLAEVAGQLDREGWQLAGVVQHNPERKGARCDMDLAILGGATVRISQHLGALSSACRLDAAGLEDAVGQVAATLDAARPDLLIVNKFGTAELGGRGFRPLIGRALEDGVPVLIGLNRLNLAGFDAFSGGIGVALPDAREPVLAWCRSLRQSAGQLEPPAI